MNWLHFKFYRVANIEEEEESGWGKEIRVREDVLNELLYFRFHLQSPSCGSQL